MSDEHKDGEDHATAHSHAADDHGHGHDDHAVPADAIKEGSVYDTALSGLALLVGAALVGLIVYWCGLKPAVVAEGEPGTQHEVQHEAPANSEPAPVR